MSLLIKVCGLRDKRHVETAIEAGAGALGFVFAESPRSVTPELARLLSDSVPRDVKRVAVMLHPSNEQWLDVLAVFRPDVLQTDAGDFASLHVPASVECWPVFREGGFLPDTDGAYVYEGPQSGHGKTVDWTAAAALARSGGMILAGGLNAGNVAAAIRTVRPFGVDASSGLESSPGQKDSQRITDFIKAAQAAENIA